jgi:hypothetical protein
MPGFHIFVTQRSFEGHSHRWPLFIVFLLFWVSCASHQRFHEQLIGDFGRIVLHQSNLGINDFVLGVPHGTAEVDAIEYAKTISDRTGAGLVIAYGFKANRIPVTQPLIHTTPISWPATDAARPASVYPEFKKFLRSASVGPLRFYVGIRIAEEAKQPPRIEVASGGLSFEQLKFLKEAYTAIRDRSIKDMPIPKVEIALNPIDDISWNAFGAKNHGVLMLAEKGLILRMPKVLTLPDFKSVYREIIAKWVIEASTVARRISVQMPEIQVKQLPYGRIDLIPSRNNSRGIVIGAPHGSFDWHTSELVEELSYRTSLASVVTRGFTPTECGGWRINVNRPTERRYPTDTVERATDRAREVYQHFTESVFEAARGPLDLYIDMHQNSSENNIDVATLGITREQARAIKSKYQEIRDRLLRNEPEVAKVNLVIEPLDQVSIGAWAAKDHGILRLSKSSLHFELPAQHVFYKEHARSVYTKILAELIDSIAISWLHSNANHRATRYRRVKDLRQESRSLNSFYFPVT